MFAKGLRSMKINVGTLGRLRASQIFSPWLFASTNTYQPNGINCKESVNFFEELAKAKNLSKQTLNILKANDFYEDELLQCDRNDFEKKLNIDFADSCKLSSWVQRKKEERRKVLRQEAMKGKDLKFLDMLAMSEDLSDEALDILKREKMNKTTLLQCEKNDFMDYFNMNLSDACKLTAWIQMKKRKRIALRKSIQRFSPSYEMSSYEEVITNEIRPSYKIDEETREALQKGLDIAFRRRCEDAAQNQFSTLFNRDFKYVGHNIVLRSSEGKLLGVVDSLFTTNDSSICVLGERKAKVEVIDATELCEKISDKVNAFKECLANTEFCNQHNISTHSSPTIYSMLHCITDNAPVYEEALNRGIFVLTFHLDFKCPPSFTPPIN